MLGNFRTEEEVIKEVVKNELEIFEKKLEENDVKETRSKLIEKLEERIENIRGKKTISNMLMIKEYRDKKEELEKKQYQEQQVAQIQVSSNSNYK